MKSMELSQIICFLRMFPAPCVLCAVIHGGDWLKNKLRSEGGRGGIVYLTIVYAVLLWRISDWICIS